jgi:SAM-dependent methyltransferase
MDTARSEKATERLERERDFHTARFVHDNRKAQRKYYDAIADCFRDYWARVDQLSVGADILECGCTYGDNAMRLAATARSATGIDISDAAIERGRAWARQKGLANVRLEAMNAEAMSFPDDSFDLVFGSGIIHHLDIDRALGEIARVLRPGGRAVFVEPLGLNSAIARPLRRRDFCRFDAAFGATAYRFYGLTTLAVVPFRRTAAKAPLLAATRALDRGLFALPAVKWLAWYSLMEAEAR